MLSMELSSPVTGASGGGLGTSTLEGGGVTAVADGTACCRDTCTSWRPFFVLSRAASTADGSGGGGAATRDFAVSIEDFTGRAVSGAAAARGGGGFGVVATDGKRAV